MISLSQAFAQWQELAAGIPKDDGPMLAESWNDYTDSLCKDGELTALQYHYAPAYDDSMPGDGTRFDPLADDREFILDVMGVTMKSTRTDSRDNADEWDRYASHWQITMRRNGKRMVTTYSMGGAHVGEPELPGVLNCLLSDAEAGAESFDDFCANFGYDTDSRKAERTHKACKRTAASLARLFSSSELADLRELFEGM